MSAAAEAPTSTTQPNSAAGDQPSRSGRLLGPVRKLIDLELILARIARGLDLATALEARVLHRAAYLDARPAPGRARSAAKAPAAPRTAEPIDYGRELAATICQRPAAEPIFAIIRFGTIWQLWLSPPCLLPELQNWRACQCRTRGWWMARQCGSMASDSARSPFLAFAFMLPVCIWNGGATTRCDPAFAGQEAARNPVPPRCRRGRRP
jgi:hypothetical protein